MHTAHEKPRAANGSSDCCCSSFSPRNTDVAILSLPDVLFSTSFKQCHRTPVVRSPNIITNVRV